MTDTRGTFVLYQVAFLLIFKGGGIMKTHNLNERDPAFFYVIVNDNPGRVLKWHKSDKNLKRRVDKLIKLLGNIKTDMLAQLSATSDVTYSWFERKGDELTNTFDKTFGDGASKAVFQGNHPLFISGETGKMLIIEALDEIMPNVQRFEMEADNYVI